MNLKKKLFYARYVILVIKDEIYGIPLTRGTLRLTLCSLVIITN